MRSVLGTLTGPRGLVVACVNRSPAAVGRSLGAGGAFIPRCKFARPSAHDPGCLPLPCPPGAAPTLDARSRVLGVGWALLWACGWRPLPTDDSTGSHLLLPPPRAIWGAGTAQGKKKVGSSHLDYVLLVSPHTSRLLHDDAGAPPLCGRVVLGLRLSAPLPRYAPYSGFRQ